MNKTNSLISHKEVSIREVFLKVRIGLSFLAGKWKFILLLSVISACLGLSASLLIAPIYKGEVTFVLENNDKSKLGSYSSLAAQFGINMGEAGGVFQEDDNIIALMRSRSIVVKTLLSPSGNGNELLVDRYVQFNNFKSRWRNNGALDHVVFGDGRSSRLEDSLLSFFYRSIIKENLIVAKPDKKIDIISISTTATDELFAKNFSENILKNVSDFYVQTQTLKSQQNVSILRKQVDSVRGLLNAALTGVALTSEANPNLNPAMQRLRVPAQKRMVDVEMNKAILSELVKNLEIAEINLRRETPLIQVIDAPVLPLDRKKIGKIKGSALGFLLGGLLAIVWLSCRRYFISVTTPRK